MRVLPPDCKPSWDELDPWTQSQLIAYSQLRDLEENPDVQESSTN